MKAVRYYETGGPEVFEVEEVEVPTPAKGEVLVSIEVADVNHIEQNFRGGFGVFSPATYPTIPGTSFAGTVEETGEGVERLSVGDRVIGAGLYGRPMGSYAEYTVIEESNVGLLPDDVSFEVGAGVSHNGVTAWRSLVDHAQLTPAEWCLIHGAAGGLGHIAVQLADVLGARVIGTSSDPDRRATLRDLGADVTLDYSSDSFAEEITSTAPAGVDVILDGFLDHYFELDLEVLAKYGRIVCVEFSEEEGGVASFSQRHTQMGNGKEASLQWVGMGNAPDVAGVLEKLADLVSAGDIEIRIADRFELDDATGAHRRLANGDYFGTLLITP